MGQPSISSIPFWKNYKRNVFFVIREALTILRQKPDLPTVEQSSKNPSLNRELYRSMRIVCNNQKLPHHLPVPEGKNPPNQGDEPASSEAKIPDFYWHVANHLADDDEAELRFVLECKRLGTPPSPDWVLNKNYVLNGICRFLLDSHEYGKGDDEGGMVGYVQDMEFADILEEINQVADECPLTIVEILPPRGGWVEGGISELEQRLEREFPIHSFRLLHFWVDIRSS